MKNEIKNLEKDRNEKAISKKEVDDEIKRLDSEILQIKKDSEENKVNDKLIQNGDQKKRDKCKYYNGGYCKYKERCRFRHPGEVCKNHLTGKCEVEKCPDRHPKPCKWFKLKTGCRRKDLCDFLHDTLVCDDGKKVYQKVLKRWRHSDVQDVNMNGMRGIVLSNTWYKK